MILFRQLHELPSELLLALLKLRQDVFILEQACLYPDIDALDLKAMHLLVFDTARSDHVICGLRILALDSQQKPSSSVAPTARIGRLVVAKDHRHQGHARQLMISAINWCKNKNHAVIQISAQTYLLGFYQSLGFNVVSDAYLEDGIEHKDMQLELN
ncbi:MAG: GNAT family N-acetyltransferase [Pseudomonadota bacterium]|nr:GNAT family N-acetyltransferase [Pseudomonadota bacterium]